MILVTRASISVIRNYMGVIVELTWVRVSKTLSIAIVSEIPSSVVNNGSSFDRS